MKLMNHEKHYNTLNNCYKAKYSAKVYKITLNGNFTCPNRDGKCGIGGCSFCSPSGSGDFAGNKGETLEKQFASQKDMMKNKWNNGKYIVYFQANTNTYAPLDRLKALFEKAITLDPNIVMLSIATRPDCLPDDVIEYLSELNTRCQVQVEFGLQTVHEKTAKEFNRGYDNDIFGTTVKRLNKANIEVVVHIINGLPGETKEMMIDTIRYLNTNNIQGIKIHMLHLMKNTKLGDDYLKENFKMLSLDEYVDITVEQILWLRKDIIIHRLTGDAPREMLITPTWTLKKFVTTNEIDKKLRLLNKYQGDYYEEFNN